MFLFPLPVDLCPELELRSSEGFSGNPTKLYCPRARIWSELDTVCTRAVFSSTESSPGTPQGEMTLLTTQ